MLEGLPKGASTWNHFIIGPRGTFKNRPETDPPYSTSVAIGRHTQAETMALYEQYGLGYALTALPGRYYTLRQCLQRDSS